MMRLSWAWRIVLALPLVGLVGWVMVAVRVPGVETASASPTDDPTRPLMVAIGDSFIAGEGAAPYLDGTNNADNRCHRSNLSYPYRVAVQLNYRLVNATCSGARTFHVADVPDVEATEQYESSPDDVWGAVPQLDAVTHPRLTPDAQAEPGDPAVVLLSIGGNDAGFGDLVEACLREDCARQLRDRLVEVRSVEPRLVAVYEAVRKAAPRARVLVVPYPNPVVVSDCVPGLSLTETQFLSERLLPALNGIISFQAARIGFEVVDAEDAFVGARPCEPGVTPNNAALNTLELATVDGSITGIQQGSFHPSAIGYQLLTQQILDHLAGPPAEVPGSGSPPPGDGPPGLPPNAGIPSDGPSDAPPVPDDLPPEDGVPGPVDAPCRAEVVARQNVRQVTAGAETETIQTTPQALVCLQVPGEPWTTVVADADGRASFYVGSLSRAEIATLRVLWQTPDGGWQLQTVVSPPDVPPPSTAWWQRLDVWVVAGILLAVLLAVPLVVGVVRAVVNAVAAAIVPAGGA